MHTEISIKFLLKVTNTLKNNQIAVKQNWQPMAKYDFCRYKTKEVTTNNTIIVVIQLVDNRNQQALTLLSKADNVSYVLCRS